MSQLNTPTLQPFPRFASAQLYLASSNDVGHLRLGAREMIDGLLNRLVTEQRIETFEWESFTAETPMDQRLNRQENLPRPSDSQCVGVIVLFGEKIGQPLADFDPSVIPGVDAWMD